MTLLYTKLSRVNSHKYSFFVRIVTAWNALPLNVVEANSYTGLTFRSSCKDLPSWLNILIDWLIELLKILGPVYMKGGTGRLPKRDDAQDPDMYMFL